MAPKRRKKSSKKVTMTASSQDESKTLLKQMKIIKKGEEKESPYRRKRYKIPEYLKAMTEIEKEQNHKIIQNMSKRINYLRNPRFKVDKAAITFDDIKDKVSFLLAYNTNKKLKSSIKDTNLDFRADPEEIVFRNY